MISCFYLALIALSSYVHLRKIVSVKCILYIYSYSTIGKFTFGTLKLDIVIFILEYLNRLL